MPGSPLLYVTDSYQGVQGEGVSASVGGGGSGPGNFGWSFWLWLIVIGVIVPGIVLGSLQAGGFQFVFRRR